MLAKRLIGVITVRDGLAVQSFGYRRHLPLGRPEVLAENLDRWGVDEIVVQCIDRWKRGAGPDVDLVARLARRGLGTPLAYVGGLRDAADAVAVVQAGAERVGVDALLHERPAEVEAIAAALGAQALVAVLPLSVRDGALLRLDHRTRRESPLETSLLALLAGGAVSEAMVVDWRNEGSAGGFDARLLERWPLPSLPRIVFGGLAAAGAMRAALETPGVVGAAVGNAFAWREHAVQRLRAELAGVPLRPAQFERLHSLLR